MRGEKAADEGKEMSLTPSMPQLEVGGRSRTYET